MLYRLNVPAHLDNYVKIKFGTITNADKIDTIQYEYKGYKTSSEAGYDLEVTLYLERRFGMYFATTFLPTVCLIMVAELTLFIDESHFEATIMVSLTSMLVMYTLYQSVVNSLPATSYLKMIDLWLLAGLILPFICFIFLIAVDNVLPPSVTHGYPPEYPGITRVDVKPILGDDLKNPKQQRKRTTCKLLRFAQITVPSATLIFFIVFFYIGLTF